ncbi:MAG: hypothetical protein QOD57_3928, partial [Actinomycetota bacterium]|nr:hypothetical protein [Actinomycetota bacterium]
MPLPDTAPNGLADVAADAAPGAAPAAGDGGVLAGPAQPDGPAGIPTTPGVRVDRVGLAAFIVIVRPQAQNAI